MMHDENTNNNSDKEVAATEETTVTPRKAKKITKSEGQAPTKRASLSEIVNTAVKRRAQTKEKTKKDEQINLLWYIVQTYSGFENKVKQTLEERIRTNHLETYFGEIKVPQEQITEMIRGQKRNVNRKFFPGYILVQMHVSEDTWHLVINTSKVVGFVGDAKEPIPMSEDEVVRLTTQMEEGTAAFSGINSFQSGDMIKVKDGPFMDFTGTVEEVKPDKGKLKVLISIFGRATPVELDFFQVEKA